MNHFDMELTQRQAKEYSRLTKSKKGEIISQYCKLTKVSRNLASKRFKKVMRNIHPRVLKKACKKRGRKPKYTMHKAIIKKVWELSGEICGERLQPVLAEYIDQLELNGELKYYRKRYIAESKDISEATLKRIISKFPKAKKYNKGNASIYKAIPIQAYFGKNADKAGFVEIDYVEHNGGNSTGVFGNTGTYIDVCLGWIARSAGLGKSLLSIKSIHNKNELKIYHKVNEYHPDNAKPILKLLLEKSLCQKPPGYSISRSRPYHKEDNGHVEQKNNDKVRKLVGYHRYDTKKQITLLNKLYNIEDLISNYFIPSQKLIEKDKDKKGRVIHKRHDKAQTAYQRLLLADIDQKVKMQVRKIHKNLNLIQLRKQSEDLQKELFRTCL